MSQTMSGLYEAEVLDTSMFHTTGKIKVRLTNMPDPEFFELVGVMTPYGGLPNMGIQALPPIGAYGLVGYIRERERWPVWIGSLLRYWQGEDKSLDKEMANPVEAEDPTEFVIKTQYTSETNQDLDSDDNKVENIVRMTEGYLQLAHIQQNDNYKYKKTPYDLDDNFPANTITIRDSEIRLKVRTDGDDFDREFIVNGDEVNFQFNEDVNIKMDADKTVIKNDAATITIKADGTVQIDADKIELKGNAKTAVLFEPLQDFINSSYNTHTHGTPAGPSSPPMSPFTATSTLKSQHTKLT